jgi:hypothetical protein
MPGPSDIWGRSSRCHNAQDGSPVEVVREPHHGQSRRIGGPCRFGLTFIIQGELFAQKEVFRGQRWAWTEAKSKVAYGLDDEREEDGCQLADMAQSI